MVCYDHTQALALHQLVRYRDDLRAPDDYSVVCFNDIYPVQLPTPALTAVAVPFAEMGQRAGEALVAMMQGGPRGGTVCLEPGLTVRESTAPPRA
ncbi:MAG: substrate-binding domain-containing protein [Planctomycetota bacterium]|nr:substrate-binding domain-containing protein [Planctomycetota bacterium]